MRGGGYGRRIGGGAGEEEPVGAAADGGRVARALHAVVGGEDGEGALGKGVAAVPAIGNSIAIRRVSAWCTTP